ncbi:MAG: anthranilate phosphoribosyltransferase [Actinomycetota bacterium]
MTGTSDDTITPSPAEHAVDWPGLLSKLVTGDDLSRADAAAAMAEILAGATDPVRIAGLLVGLAAKGETVEELTGMATAMRAAAEPLRVDDAAIDIVGTGGSAHRRAHALNVSTMASIVAASAGALVCKHGNRKASSTSGSFDFLEALGVTIELGPRELEACVEEIGVGFAFARAFHPAMRFAGPVRAALGIPTVFNLLGPVANPAGVRRQVVGVASADRAELIAGALQELGSSSSWVVAGHGGIDELALTGTSEVWSVTPAGVDRHVVELADLGLAPVDPAALAGGEPAVNAALFEAVIGGERGPVRDIVVLNAAAGLVVAGVSADLAAGCAAASAAIDDGRTGDKLEQLRLTTTRLASGG